jgi:hypothetical protein
MGKWTRPLAVSQQEQAWQVKARLAEWFALRKLLIKRATAAIERIRKGLAAEMLALCGSNVQVVLATIVPITRGWAAYYWGVVSLDNSTLRLIREQKCRCPH